MHNILCARSRSTDSPSNTAQNVRTQSLIQTQRTAEIDRQNFQIQYIQIPPSNQHFKAFLMSKFNSETSFLYQLFKGNSNLIVLKPCKVIDLSIFMIFIIIYIQSYLYLFIYTPSYQHFKAFPVSKFNSETSFLYQFFKGNSNFIVLKPCTLIYLSIFL